MQQSNFVKNLIVTSALFAGIGIVSWFLGVGAVIVLDTIDEIDEWGLPVTGVITLAGFSGYILSSYHVVVKRSRASRLQYLTCSLLPPAVLLLLGYFVVRNVRFGW